MSKEKIIGIDLGTTNSVVSVMEGGDPVVIQNSEGARTTPSIVAFTAKGETLIGQFAKNQAITNAVNTIRSAKRFIGRRLNECESEMKHVSYKVVRSGNEGVKFETSAGEFTPQEISARVLMKMKQTAEDYLGQKVTKAVITVPAYFNDEQRQATKDAGRIAGLEVERIINEPTAAALAYGFDKKNINSKIAVYDLGGGTFDISILELADGVFEVKSTNGDTHLGGDDFDMAIMEWMISEFKNQTGIDISSDKNTVQRLKEAAEKAKIELSGTMSTQINLPFITADASGPKHLDMTLSRAKFDQLTKTLVDRTRIPCENALRDAGLKASDINEVILVGGSIRIPRRPRTRQTGFRKRAEQIRKSGRSSRDRSRNSGRSIGRRSFGRSSSRCDSSFTRNRNTRRCDDQVDRKKHYDSYEEIPSVLHRGGQSIRGIDPRSPR